LSENEIINESTVKSQTGTLDFLLNEIKNPSGEKLQTVIATAKTFSSGREGFFAQIQPFVINGKVYGGQIQIWEKSIKK
jgi:hypothetical protein